MKNSIRVTFFIFVIGMSWCVSGMFIIEEINDLAKQQQHILELCRSEKKDNEHCKIINDVFTRPTAWVNMSLLKKVFHYKKMPMAADLTRAVLHSQATRLGTQLGWDKSRREEESHLLIDEYDAFNSMQNK